LRSPLEPIVCTREDAFRCFMGTEMDALAIGNCFLRKEHQDPRLSPSAALASEPD
jgi:carbamoyltransferase